jgi:hypothetical protein
VFGDKPVRGTQCIVDLAVSLASIQWWSWLGQAHNRTIPDGDAENGEPLHTFGILCATSSRFLAFGDAVTTTNTAPAMRQCNRAGGYCLEKSDHFDGRRRF